MILDGPRAGSGAVVGALIGVAVGVGVFTFGYARGASYLTDDPAACANCHVMEDVYVRWMRGPHRSAAACNDCHTPHDPVGKWTTKALNGLRHSVAFTVGSVPDAILITSRDRAITERACLACHAAVTEPIRAAAPPAAHGGGGVACLHCHADVGHR
jgi:cytochrome c nitrite reductase small subunit